MLTLFHAITDTMVWVGGHVMYKKINNIDTVALPEAKREIGKVDNIHVDTIYL